MRSFESPGRVLHLIEGSGHFVFAGGMVVLSLLDPLDNTTRIFMFILVPALALSGSFHFWSALRTPSVAAVTLIPGRAPVPEQIRILRRSLWLSAFAFSLVSICVAYDLHQLETGVVDYVRTAEFSGFLYEHFGYWTAVLAIPVLGFICCTGFVLKLRKLTERESI